jgi:hypothetical protein
MFKSFLNNINFNFFKVEIYFLIVSDKQSSLRKVFRGSKGKVHESEKKFNSKICSYYTFGLRTLKLKLLQLCGDIECNPGPCKGNPELILMTQNCRGLQDYNKMRLLLRNKNAAMNKGKLVLALQETHLMNDDLIKWSGNYAFSSSASPHSAGCITYFNDYVRILEVRQIDNLGHGHVAVVEGLTVHIAIIANVYSPVRSLGREQDRFYEHLMTIVDELEQKYLFNEPNLMILGDFNLPLELNRNSHGNDLERERAKSLVEHFDSKGLIDCWKLNDERYTFRTAQSRLDRILYRMNTVYMEELETDWTFTNSDHCLLKLSLCSTRGKAVHTRVVSLPMYLLENEEAVKMINDKMTDMASDCLDHWEPGMKLEYLKMSLRTTVGEVTKLLNKRVNDDLEAIKKSITWRMGRMRSLPLHAWEENNMQLELLFTRRNLILDERSKKLAEKAKTKWFHEGEKANKYFLNLLNKRKGLNVIEKLVTDGGEITNDDEIDDEINTFYKNLYERGEPLGSNIDNNFYEHIVKVNNADAAKVISPLSKEEIFEVLSSCKDSAPGPDGIPYSYYRKFWFFFGDIIAQVWQDGLTNGSLPVSHKTSILRLLPKVGKDATKLTNWRPITLSNCDHKLITKCLARRLTNALGPCLHPDQTAYLPGKQIQDNLRVINIVNEQSPETLVVSLDAKKAFDSVSHDYIRKTLTEFGLGDFVPIFNLLYDKQKVNINVNGRMLDGYEICNGVKQGDSLSCILFIMCMDPLIRNIEMNANITRVDIRNIPFPKAVAYADDITCIIENNEANLQGIFDEYERLSKASGLSLNAEKTEILDNNASSFRVRYGNETHRIQGVRSVKINGVVYNKDTRQMREDNFNHLVAKIDNMLRGWRARNLSLLGKILIYKTFGLSQVIYVLSVIRLNQSQYKKLDLMFNNFLWGRDLEGAGTGSRIGRERLDTPMEYGGFGMIRYDRVLEGIHCRQLSKMYDEDFRHPLKSIIIKNDTHFATGTSLTELADEVAIKAHQIMSTVMLTQIKKLNGQQITEDVILTNLLGTRDIVTLIKPRWIHSVEATRLVHTLGCTNIKDIMDCGRMAVKISKKIVKSPYLKVIKTLWQSNTRCANFRSEKFRMTNGTYKLIHKITSKEYRGIITGKPRLIAPKILLETNVNNDYDEETLKRYLFTVKRLANTRHKNTLLRVWNGDCLSYTRLFHLGIVNTNLCPNCGRLDTPLHTLVECHVADRVWTSLMVKIPKSPHIRLIDYALGIHDGKIELSVKAETLKMLMHFRHMDADGIHRRLKNYFLTVNSRNAKIRTMFT